MSNKRFILAGHLLIALVVGSIKPVLPQNERREVAAVLGNAAILPCEVDFLGSQHVIWKDPNSEMLTINEQRLVDDPRISVLRPYVKEWNLRINAIRKSDQGVYSCVINTSPTVTKHVELKIQYPPKIEEHSAREVPVKIGDDVQIFCKASGYPPPIITWYKFTFDGKKRELASGLETLEMKNISREQGGTYECNADNGIAPSDQQTFKIDIKYAPEINLPYQRISQKTGQDTLLECMITANPLTTHYWAKDGARLTNSDKYRIQTWDVGEFIRTLGAFVYNLEPSDFGRYTCVAENEFGRAEKSLHVHDYLVGEIRVLSVPRDAVRARGQGALFNCTVEGLGHKDSLTWWHVTSWGHHQRLFVSHPDSQGHHVTYLDLNKYEIRGHYNLYIKNASLDDAGMYVCQITGQQNLTAQFTVVESPRCDVNSTMVEEGSRVKMTCSMWYAGADNLNWQVEWHHGDRKLSTINEDMSGKVHRFVTFLASTTDAGVYYCKIKSQQPEYLDQCRAALTVKHCDPYDPYDPYEREGSSGAICQDTSTMITTNVAMVILAAGVGALLILFICILTAVVINFKKQIRKYTRGQRSAVRYKNGSVNMETDALTRENDHTEVDRYEFR